MKERSNVVAVASLLGVLVLTRKADAYRPFDTTDADIAGPREIEVELGPAGYLYEGSERALVAPALVLNYGLTPRLEAVLEARDNWRFGAHRLRSRVDDVALSLKTLLREGTLQGKRGMSIAVETGLLLPGTERRFGAHLSTIFSMRWPAATLHVNVNHDFLFSIRYEAGASVIVEGPQSWWVRPVTEALLQRDFGNRDVLSSAAKSVLVGAIAPCGDDLSFDVALRYGRAEHQSSAEARAGFTWAFEAW
ncbi:MAG TPA: hypothetical protein VIV60_19485 [Polyangiaceae bacterium]